MDVVVKVAVFYVGFKAPDAGEKKGAGKNLAGVAEKDFKKGTFAAGKGALFGAFGEASAFRIEGDVTKLQKI